MNRTADLDTALGFVIRRIEEEATRSGEPLSDEQRFLLNHLPKDSALPQPDGGSPEIPTQPQLVPRDTTYERLCAVAKAAHHSDMRMNPSTAIDWDLAAAVSKLNRHPISWLLHWAGVKVHRPWWDHWLLFATALLFVFSLGTLMILAVAEGWSKPQWVGFAAIYIALLALAYFASRRIEEWQLKQSIEKYRRGSASTAVT